MAGDWIKMRMDLQSHPKIVRILSATSSDKFRVIGGLHAVWSIFDTHSEDGVLPGYTPDALDHVIGWPGFARALLSVGWMVEKPGDCLVMPEFGEHNGKSGKRRAEDQKRKRESRMCPQSVRNLSDDDSDNLVTREEKRREEEKNPPSPQIGGEKSAARRERKPRTTLKTFLETCRSAEQKPISEYQPLLNYMGKTSLPEDYVSLCWDVFKREHLEDGKNAARLQADWRRHFLNYVEKGYYRLWYARADGSFELTTQGIQAQRFHEDRNT